MLDNRNVDLVQEAIIDVAELAGVAETARALPSKLAAQRGQNWTPMRAHCLIKNVTGELTVRSGAAIPNRIGVADGRTDQHGCAARDHGSGGRPLSISRAGR